MSRLSIGKSIPVENDGVPGIRVAHRHNKFVAEICWQLKS